MNLDEELERLRYQQALGAARIGTWWMDLVSNVAQCDAVAADLVGDESDDLVSADWVHPDDREAMLESRARSVATGAVHDIEFRPMSKDGKVRWLRAIARPAADSGFGRRWLTGVVFDVTERRNIESALLESRRQLTTLLNNLPGIAYRCGATIPWKMEFLSNAVIDITGYDAQHIMALCDGWSEIMHPDDLKTTAAAVEHALADGTSFSIRYRIVHQSGEIRWVHERGEATYDERGAPRFIEGFIWDVSDQRAADERLKWTAAHDGLTHLPNRSLFQQRLDEAMERAAANGSRVGVFLLDLDDFKIINDTLGHDAGDALLRSVADRLRLATRPGDVVARLSGDEFAILVEDDAKSSAIHDIGEKIVASFHDPFMHDGRLFDCHGSLGLSIYPQDAEDRISLMKDADMALYAAKADGGGRLKFYEPSMRNEMVDRSSMLTLAREALASDWILPYYQPKVDLATGQISGFEALLRWNHPVGGLQMPETITAAFHDLDLAASISDRMIKLVIADIVGWTEQGIDFGHVAINAAAAEFRRGNFPEMLLNRLAEAGIAPEKVQIEVTETVFLGRGAEYVESALKQLSAAGVAIALDDFGTGYASLSHLKQFPVDALKIDRSFIRDLHADPDDAAIVHAVISLGKSLGIKIIAEGIETTAQAAYLKRNECDFGQGYLFGAAVSAHEVSEVLAGARAPLRRVRVA